MSTYQSGLSNSKCASAFIIKNVGRGNVLFLIGFFNDIDLFFFKLFTCRKYGKARRGPLTLTLPPTQMDVHWCMIFTFMVSMTRFMTNVPNPKNAIAVKVRSYKSVAVSPNNFVVPPSVLLLLSLESSS